MFAEAVGAFDSVVVRVGRGGGGVRARFVVPGAHIAPGGLGRTVMGGVPPSHANAALPSRRGDGPGFAAPRNRVERHIGLEESFSGRGSVVVRDFDENGGGESDGLACRDDETWLLDELHGLPPRVARDGLVQPLVSDCSAVWMTSWYEWKLEEGGSPPVKHLNVYRVDLLQLLDERCVVVGIQNLRKGEDIIV